MLAIVQYDALMSKLMTSYIVQFICIFVFDTGTMWHKCAATWLTACMPRISWQDFGVPSVEKEYEIYSRINRGRVLKASIRWPLPEPVVMDPAGRDIRIATTLQI